MFSKPKAMLRETDIVKSGKKRDRKTNLERLAFANVGTSAVSMAACQRGRGGKESSVLLEDEFRSEDSGSGEEKEIREKKGGRESIFRINM